MGRTIDGENDFQRRNEYTLSWFCEDTPDNHDLHDCDSPSNFRQANVEEDISKEDISCYLRELSEQEHELGHLDKELSGH